MIYFLYMRLTEWKKGFSPDDVLLHRELELPIVPQAGTVIFEGDLVAQVEQVCIWDKRVCLVVQPQRGKGMTKPEVVESFIEKGWAVAELDPEKYWWPERAD